MKNLFIAFILACLLTSCNSYYKAVLAPSPASVQKIEDLKSGKRYFILRDGNSAFTMNNISFSTDQKTLQCTLDSMPPFEHRVHLTKKANGNMKYKDKKISDEDESAVLNEVHIYINSNGNIAVGTYTLPLDQVLKIEILEKDKVKTRASHITGMAISVGGAALLAGVIIASTSVLSGFSF